MRCGKRRRRELGRGCSCGRWDRWAELRETFGGGKVNGGK